MGFTGQALAVGCWMAVSLTAATADKDAPVATADKDAPVQPDSPVSTPPATVAETAPPSGTMGLFTFTETESGIEFVRLAPRDGVRQITWSYPGSSHARAQYLSRNVKGDILLTVSDSSGVALYTGARDGGALVPVPATEPRTEVGYHHTDGSIRFHVRSPPQVDDSTQEAWVESTARRPRWTTTRSRPETEACAVTTPWSPRDGACSTSTSGRRPNSRASPTAPTVAPGRPPHPARSIP